MPPEQWEKVKNLFADALDQPEEVRAAFVSERCQGEPAVWAEVLRLLHYSPSREGHLDRALWSPGLLQQAAQQAASYTPLQTGEVLAGRFRIIRLLGAGGMGEVYEAEDQNLASRIAIKTIRPEIAGDPQVLARFRREVNLARQVTHPNVCRVFDLAHATRSNGAELDFLTMEYLEGETLSSYLQARPPLTLAEAGPLIRQIAEGLGAAHQAGVIHRDLKGANIFLARQREGEVRVAVTDFGLARSIVPSDGTSLTQSGWGAGTPAYMAPEQIEGQPTGPPADFYSLGVVMYEMATGRPPHAGHSPLEIAVRRLKQRPTAPHEITPGIDPKWEAVILRCLEPDPADRFADSAALLAALGNRQILSGLRPTVRRKISRALLWAMPAVALLAAGAWWMVRTPTLPEPTARLYTEGLNALADGSYLKANRLLEQTVQQQPSFVPATLRLAETYLELDQIRKAQETLLRVSDRWIPSTETRLLRDALRLLILRDYESAIPILKQRAAAADTTQAQLDLARALERANHLEESAAQYEQVLKRDPAQAGALLRLAAVASAKADRPAAERYVGEAQQAYNRFGNAEGQGEADLVRANMAKELNELARAREFAAAGAERGRQTSSPWLEIRAQLVQAAIDVLDAKPQEAGQKAEAAIARAREAGLETLACQGLIDLGIAHLSQVQDRRAEQVHREALAIAERNDAPFYAASARLGLAMDLSGQARGEESVATARQAQAYFAKTSFRLKQIETLRVLGHAYFGQSDWEHASQYYGEAAKMADRPWEAGLRLRNLQSQVSVELRRGNFPAVRDANTAILKGKVPALTARQARLALANVARMLGHYAEANRLTNELLADPDSRNGGFWQQVQTARVSLLAAEGKTDAAVAISREIAEAAQKEGRQTNRDDVEARVCGILAVDPTADARAAIRRCEAVLAGQTDKSSQSAAEVQLSLAEAYFRAGQLPAAEAANRLAQSSFVAKQSINNLFYGRLLEAAIYEATGRVADAGVSRTAATTVFRQMVAAWPLEDQRSYLARPAVSRLSQRAHWTYN